MRIESKRSADHSFDAKKPQSEAASRFGSILQNIQGQQRVDLPSEKAADDALVQTFENSGLSELANDQSKWHQIMGQTFGYQNAGVSSQAMTNSEDLRQRVQAAGKSGDWGSLGIEVAVASNDVLQGHRAAFAGGDTANLADDRILVNIDELKENGADKSLEEALTEEIFHSFERQVHRGKNGDIRLTKDNTVTFASNFEGRALDEGTLGRQLLQSNGRGVEFALNNSSVLNDDHQMLSTGVAVEFAPHTLDEAIGNNNDHSVRYRINRADWSNADINNAFSGPDAFQGIWSHHEHDQDLVGWISGKNLQGSRGQTAGITAYVGWGMSQDTAQNEKVDAFLRSSGWLNKITNDDFNGTGDDPTRQISTGMTSWIASDILLGLDGTRSGTTAVQEGLKWKLDNGHQADVKNVFKNINAADFINRFDNNQLNGADKNISIAPEVLAQADVVQLTQAGGTRSGMKAVQNALEYKLAGSVEENNQLKEHFSKDNNGKHFLEKFTDDQIMAMSPRMLSNIPLEQLQNARGTRGEAAVETVIAAGSNNSAGSRTLSGGNDHAFQLIGWRGESNQDPFQQQMQAAISEILLKLGESLDLGSNASGNSFALSMNAQQHFVLGLAGSSDPNLPSTSSAPNGNVTFSINGNQATIHTITAQPEGQGLGTQLMHHLAQHLSGQGVTTVEATSVATPAIPAYSSWGFVPNHGEYLNVQATFSSLNDEEINQQFEKKFERPPNSDEDARHLLIQANVATWWVSTQELLSRTTRPPT